jgi:uncharacterized protein YggE
MRRSQSYLTLGLLAAVAGCSVRAQDESQSADQTGGIRISKDAVRTLMAPSRQVSVVGSAQDSVAPDVADISLGVTVTRPTVAEAVEMNNRAMGDLVEAVKRHGVDPKDVQTSHISISPRYSQPVEPKAGTPLPPEEPSPAWSGMTSATRSALRCAT